MYSPMLIILGWIFIAIINSQDWDHRSVVIWLATIIIIISQIQIMLFLR